MPQDVELFSGTIAENISRFQGVDSDAIVSASKRAGVHELILELPNGYDTSIGPGGQALSGGQRQRIALARALYKEPKIIVLDEPNANLDSAGERALTEAIVEAKNGGATVILISHRPNLLNCTDEIAVLRDGSLVKVGPRNQILQDLSAPGASNPSKSPSNN
jgi:ABC-type protease/lipase transport system fused ATPase/permease subunit